MDEGAKKRIKVRFANVFDRGYPKENSILWDILQRHYAIDENEEADFLFASSLTNPPFSYCGFDGVRLLFNGENFSPDFNLFDYCLGYEYLTYGDRYFRAPFWLLYKDAVSLETQHLQFIGKDELKNKPHFCNFIYNHPGDGERRVEMMERLARYRRVDCAGRYKNNMPDDWFVGSYAEKLDFQRRCKFTIAFDSVTLPGFVTEKLVHAFQARTVPIYLGDPTVAETFNPRAFINAADYPSLEAVAAEVERLDQDDEAYLAMLNEAVFVQPGYVSAQHRALEGFLTHIFDQDKPAAYRRSRTHAAKRHNDRLLACSNKLARMEKDTFFRRSWRYARQEYAAGGIGQVLRKLGAKISYNAGLILHGRTNKRKSNTM